MESAMKPFLTIAEFAALMGCSYSTAWGWVAGGLVKAEEKERAKTKTYRVYRDAAEEAKKRKEAGLWV